MSCTVAVKLQQNFFLIPLNLCQSVVDYVRQYWQGKGKWVKNWLFQIPIPSLFSIAFHEMEKTVFNLFCHTASGVPVSKPLHCSFCATTNRFFMTKSAMACTATLSIYLVLLSKISVSSLLDVTLTVLS